MNRKPGFCLSVEFYWTNTHHRGTEITEAAQSFFLTSS